MDLRTYSLSISRIDSLHQLRNQPTWTGISPYLPQVGKRWWFWDGVDSFVVSPTPVHDICLNKSGMFVAYKDQFGENKVFMVKIKGSASSVELSGMPEWSEVGFNEYNLEDASKYDSEFTGMDEI